jgi:hypothetical protein
LTFVFDFDFDFDFIICFLLLYCLFSNSAVKGDYNLTATPFYFDVVLGSTHKFGQSRIGTPYRIRADRIVLYPNRTESAVYKGLEWDVALVRLSVPVGYTDYIQPLCLPHPAQSVPATSLCYAAGWGYISSLQRKSVCVCVCFTVLLF